MTRANQGIDLETVIQTSKLPLWAKIGGYFLGLGLVYVGLRFLLEPEAAEQGFGLIYKQPDYSFHYTKGARDLSWGLLLTVLTILNWRKPLGVAMLAGSLVPVVDMLVVLRAPMAVSWTAWVHGGTAILCLVIGCFLLRNQTNPRHAAV